MLSRRKKAVVFRKQAATFPKRPPASLRRSAKRGIASCVKRQPACCERVTAKY
jgi:hypothetical protein